VRRPVVAGRSGRLVQEGGRGAEGRGRPEPHVRHRAGPGAGVFLALAHAPAVPLRLTTAGESHGPRLTAILEGIPAGLTIDAAFVAAELARRQHGYGRGGR